MLKIGSRHAKNPHLHRHQNSRNACHRIRRNAVGNASDRQRREVGASEIDPSHPEIPGRHHAGAAVWNKSPFALKTALPGAFPSMKRPKVFWLGLQPERLKDLSRIHAKLETELASNGYPNETRAFKPHLTIGRVKYSKNLAEVAENFSAYPVSQIEIPVTEVLVMKSELRRNGAIYTIQKAFLFSG